MRITILHSAVSATAGLDDQETLLQAAAIHEVLAQKGHHVSELAFTLDFSSLIRALKQQKPDVVFNLVESIEGSTELVHLVPMLMDQLQIPYTGADANTMYLCTHKILSKQWLRAGQLPTPAWTTAEEYSIASHAFFPSIVKSVTEHGSFGIDKDAIVYDSQALRAQLHARNQQHGGKWYAEQFIIGREFNIAMLSSSTEFQLFPIAEMQFINPNKLGFGIIDYACKWDADDPSYHAVQRTFLTPQEQTLNQYLADLGLRCSQWCKLSGYARIDIRLDADQQAWILEVNVNPSLAPDAGFAAQAAAMGLGYADLIENIVNLGFSDCR